ncbi:ATP-binding protein [Rhodoligotrophos defluvii]|uniref:ATP-binding protein n=1 Tax=Rhodoligotrophos defluvii TaxID=2561934 RepID=UPI0010C9C9A1|nr:ATP-binding protein [Rhodoligotrophos defluvii]
MTAPKIILFAGQRVNAEDQPGPFPASLEAAAQAAIRSHLEGAGPLIGYASATAGGDILFGEAVVALGGKLNIHIPCERQDFIDQYVAPAGHAWVERFERLCARAATFNVNCEERLLGDPTLIRFNNQVLQGLARLEAEAVGTTAHLLLLWSPSAVAELGSPADFMDHWPELDRLSIIDLDELGGSEAAASPAELDPLASDLGISPRAIRAILFADIATYTNFRDDEIPLLFDLLGEAQQMVEDACRPPLLINTWGDAIHAAAETAHDLADYAAALSHAVAEIDPARYGLARAPRFRIALHAGPVFIGLHPMTGRSMIFGHHVNRAARIEPVALPGQIFASQHFVALLRAEIDERLYEAAMTGTPYSPRYAVEYHGSVELPKRFGREAIYRVIDLSRAALPGDVERPSVSDQSVPPSLHATIRNDVAEIEVLARKVDAFCQGHGLGPDIAHAVNLSLDELITNTISYGYDDGEAHWIEVGLRLGGGVLTVHVSDDAAPYDPRETPAPDLEAELDERAIGGLGVHLVREMMDRIDYERRNGRNEVRLTKVVGERT